MATLEQRLYARIEQEIQKASNYKMSITVNYTIRDKKNNTQHELEARTSEDDMVDEIIEALGYLSAEEIENLPEDWSEFEIIGVEVDGDPDFSLRGWENNIPRLSQLAELVEFIEHNDRHNVLQEAMAALAYHNDLSYAQDSVDNYVGCFRSYTEIGECLIQEFKEGSLNKDLHPYFDFAKYAGDQEDNGLVIVEADTRKFYVFAS